MAKPQSAPGEKWRRAHKTETQTISGKGAHPAGTQNWKSIRKRTGTCVPAFNTCPFHTMNACIKNCTS